MPINVPKSLKDDHLKDTIIQVVFKTNYNLEYIHGVVTDTLKQLDGNSIVPQDVDSNNPTPLIYGSDNFRIRLDPNQIQFNCIQSYPGWVAFSPIVYSFLEALSKIAEFTKVGIKYISVFEGVSIFQNINGTIHIKSFPPLKGEEYMFRAMVSENDQPVPNAQATVKLINNRPVGPQTVASFVDITLETNASNENYIAYLEFIHKHEKLLFFNLITEEFKNSLGPTY